MERACGKCTVCCTLQGVKALPSGEPKLPGVRCPLLSHSSRCYGCTVYETRPQECQDYRCAWLEGVGEKHHRPDRIGMIVEVHAQKDGSEVCVCRVTYKGKEKGKHAAQLIERLSRHIRVVVVTPDMAKGWKTEIEVPE